MGTSQTNKNRTHYHSEHRNVKQQQRNIKKTTESETRPPRTHSSMLYADRLRIPSEQIVFIVRSSVISLWRSPWRTCWATANSTYANAISCGMLFLSQCWKASKTFKNVSLNSDSLEIIVTCQPSPNSLWNDSFPLLYLVAFIGYFVATPTAVKRRKEWETTKANENKMQM